MRRKQLSLTAIKLKKVWIKKYQIIETHQLKLHGTLVKSVLLYNGGACGLTKQDKANLKSFYHQQ